MDARHDPDHESFRDSERSFLHLAVRPRGDQYIEARQFPREYVAVLRPAWAARPADPRAAAGSAAGDFRYKAVLCEELGKVSMSRAPATASTPTSSRADPGGLGGHRTMRGLREHGRAITASATDQNDVPPPSAPSSVTVPAAEHGLDVNVRFDRRSVRRPAWVRWPWSRRCCWPCGCSRGKPLPVPGDAGLAVRDLAGTRDPCPDPPRAVQGRCRRDHGPQRGPGRRPAGRGLRPAVPRPGYRVRSRRAGVVHVTGRLGRRQVRRLVGYLDDRLLPELEPRTDRLLGRVAVRRRDGRGRLPVCGVVRSRDRVGVRVLLRR